MKFKSWFVYLLQIRILYKKQLSFQVRKEASEVTAYFLVRSHATSLWGKGSERATQLAPFVCAAYAPNVGKYLHDLRRPSLILALLISCLTSRHSDS